MRQPCPLAERVQPSASRSSLALDLGQVSIDPTIVEIHLRDLSSGSRVPLRLLLCPYLCRMRHGMFTIILSSVGLSTSSQSLLAEFSQAQRSRYSPDRHLAPCAAPVQQFMSFKRSLGITKSILVQGLSCGHQLIT